MPQLYFTNVLTVLYMMEQFGVKFVAADELSENEMIDFSEYGVEAENLRALVETFKDCYPKKIYVAKESEYIFLPKDGDIGVDLSNDCYDYFSGWLPHNKQLINAPSHSIRILTRRGKQFFPPLKEEAI